MDVQAWENDIVTRLQTLIVSSPPLIEAAAADEPIKTHPNGHIYVSFDSFNTIDEPPNRSKILVQNVEYIFNVTVRHSNLFKHGGIYTLVNQIRDALSDYTITGLDDFSVLMPIGGSYTNREKGDYQFKIDFRMVGYEI